MNTIANLGAYLSTFASCVPTILYATLLAGQYTTPAIYCEVTAVFTNTTPVDAYRGAGRPEATYVVERIVETAARETGLDPAELRRRNFIPKDAFPYQTPVALQYDTGDYEATLDAGAQAGRLRRTSPAGAPPRRPRASCAASASPATSRPAASRRPRWSARSARRRPVRERQGPLHPHRHRAGVHRHRTATARATRPRSRRWSPTSSACRSRTSRSMHGDTDEDPVRHGHLRLALDRGRRHGDREAADKIIAKGKKIAAHLLEAAEADIEFKDGEFTVEGTDRAKTLRRGGVRGLRAAQLPARQARAGPGGDGVLRSRQLHLPGRLLHLRGRGRSGHRRGQDRPLHRGRRLRQGHQPDDRRGPGARRPRPGHRPGADRGLRLRRRAASCSPARYMDYCMPQGGRRAELQGRH